MSEDVSAQVRLGATIILVAAVIAAVLSLMVVAQTILNAGMSTLQSGVDQISLQEFEKYNQKKVSGTEVKSALSLYEGRDISICIRTKSCIDDSTKPWCYMYGTLLMSTSGTEPHTDATKVFWANDATPASDIITKNAGEAHYTANLYTKNDLVQVSYETKGILTVGSPQYILDSARFRASLIKASGGTIVGILFEQLN